MYISDLKHLGGSKRLRSDDRQCRSQQFFGGGRETVCVTRRTMRRNSSSRYNSQLKHKSLRPYSQLLTLYQIRQQYRSCD